MDLASLEPRKAILNIHPRRTEVTEKMVTYFRLLGVCFFRFLGGAGGSGTQGVGCGDGYGGADGSGLGG
jgi:hypothetical protein